MASRYFIHSSKGLDGRHLINIKRRVFGRMDDQQGRLLAGRQILWVLYKQYRTRKDWGQVYSIMDLVGVKWKGDQHIESFRNDWENTVVNMHHDVTRDTKATICSTR